MTTLIDPFSMPDEDGYIWLKGNLHAHTTNSDGRISPQERVDGYAAHGYDFLSVTDHHRITPLDSVRCPEGLTLVQGVELHPDNPFGGQRHHFLAYLVREDMDAERMPPQYVIDAVKEQGGSIWLAHPYWSSINIMRDILPLRGLDGIEVFNTTCRCVARGDSGVHWDDWMDLTGQLLPAMANDDSHRTEDGMDSDVYQGWTMVRVKERTPEAIVSALVSGASYSSTGPQIHDIQVRVSEDEEGRVPEVEISVRCSPALRIFAVCDMFGKEYWEGGQLFEKATFQLRRKREAKHVRIEVHAPDGAKAWSNPIDLTKLA